PPVVTPPPRFSTEPASTRFSRSHASWTASSASASDPSMRYATARRWVRCCSKRSASSSRSSIGHIPPSGGVRQTDPPRRGDVTNTIRSDPMRVLVVGASGAIGTRLVPQLIERGHEVIGTHVSPMTADRIGGLGAVPVQLDLRDARAVRKAVLEAQPDAIVLQATALSDLR